jgi:ribokinase
VDILVVNAVEAEALAGRPVAALEDAEAAARVLAARLPVAVVTAGAHGVAVAEGAASFARPAERVVARGTHGAGDRFVGTLVARLAAGASLEDAVAEASRAAARHVAR